jgi:hypothetical protein
MNDIVAATVRRLPYGPRGRPRRAGPLAALTALAATACGGPGGPAPVALRTSASAGQRQLPGSAKCTRPPARPSPPSPAIACDRLHPSGQRTAPPDQAQPGQSLARPGQTLPGRTSQPNPRPDPSLQSELLKYVRCMRAHGISDFPYPPAQGGAPISINSNSSVDTSSAQFQKAQQACQSLLNTNGGLP